jgi:hypothetical protein
MLLLSVKVGPFRSINEAQTVSIDPEITVLVGMNESGKTVFLSALEKSYDVLGLAKFDPTPDYPRKDLAAYSKRHQQDPDDVVILEYQLDDDEVDRINSQLHTTLPHGWQFTVTSDYANSRLLLINIDERPVVEHIHETAQNLSSDALSAIQASALVREIPGKLKATNLTDKDKEFFSAIEQRVSAAGKGWSSVVGWEVWQWLQPRVPRFLYFSDYDLLPSKMNLTELGQKVEQAKTDPKALKPAHRAVLALLRMADISVAEMTKSGGYEQLKAKIEGVSINLTDQIMEFWKQNEDLEVEVDIKSDAEDEAPFNSGPNLYLRIKNRRHRGVSTPFQQRSRGFIWFFSFLVWFDSVQHQLDVNPGQPVEAGKPAKKVDTSEKGLILLLDEPGLALHALAQADFLRYIDELAEKHQVIYSTHSPFMIHSDRLGQVRLVEDKANVGTVITDNLTGSDPRTIFPLQAALGWTIAQNLFIGLRNLLVEGISEITIFQHVSALLAQKGRVGLREDITIVPTGGLDKVATFVSLLRGNQLEIACAVDTPRDQKGRERIEQQIRDKIIADRAVLYFDAFTALNPADLEDLFDRGQYVDLFNTAFVSEHVIKLEDVADPNTSIIQQINAAIGKQRFNHYRPAMALVRMSNSGLLELSAPTLDRFENLFKRINGLFSK